MFDTNGRIILKQTPFVFLKALLIIEFFFALLPFLLAWLLNFAAFYNESIVAETLSYNFFSALMLTVLQLFSLGLAFLWWYLPAYQIDRERIVHLRRNLLADTELAPTAAITGTAVHFGPLGKRFDYGDVRLHLADRPKSPVLKNVPDPARLARTIESWRDEATAVDPAETFALTQPIPALIAGGENQHVEFKASFLWDYQRQNANKALHVPVLKNVAAFMNGGGGVVLVGVADDGDVLGLEADFKIMKKKDKDGWENSFNMAFNQLIGPEYRQYVTVEFPDLAGQIIAVLLVRPSPEPVYLNANGKETFYIKTGNATQPLSVRQAHHYIQSHFRQP